MKQYIRELDILMLAKRFKRGHLDGTAASKILLPAIENTLGRKVEHTLNHWGHRGWWYHATVTEEEWILLRLKFFT